jgi:O-antigen/teichoic acid export membrane protein
VSSRSLTLRNTAFSSVGLYTEYVLGMLTSIVIARHLGPDDFGTYSLAIWMVALGVAVTNSGTASAAIKFVAELRGGNRAYMIPVLLDRLRRVQHVFLLAVLVAGTLVFLFAGDRLVPGMNQWMLLGFLVLAVSFRAAYMFNIGVAKGFENFRATAVVALVSTPVNLALVLMAWLLDAPVAWFLVIFGVSGLVFYAISTYQVSALLPARADPAPLPPDLMSRTTRHIGWSALTVSIGFLSASEVEVLFLELYHGGDAAGHFKVAYQLALGAAMLVPGVFGALLLPMMSKALSQGREIAGRRFVASTTYLSMLALPLIAYGVIFSEAIIGLLYGDAYADAVPAFAVCIAVSSIVVMTQAASSMLISADRQGSVLAVVAAGAALKIGLDVVLISRHGLAGAVTAYAIAGLFISASMMLLATRSSRAMPDWRRMARVFIAAALAALLVLPLRGQLVPLAQVVAGGLLMFASYVPLTLMLGCWSEGDIEHLQHLHQRLVGGRPKAGARLLQWALARASEQHRR